MDDDLSFAGALSDFFRGRGYSVEVAASIKDGLALVRGERPDIVLLDLALSDGSGWSFLTTFRQEGNRDVPVIVISSTRVSRSQLKDKVLTAALVKPFSPQVLLDVVEQALQERAFHKGKGTENDLA
jgi:DNA-binding response OmpR family regulator